MALFTPEELAELAAADKEIDESFCLTNEELRESRMRDRRAKLDAMDNRERKIADQQRAYYEANREKIADQQRAYYEANREKIADQKRAYYEANRENWNRYMRDYRKKKKEKERKTLI